MNKKELPLIVEIGTDIKWLKQIREEDAVWLQKSLTGIETHLAKLNDRVKNNTIGVAANRVNIKWIIKIGSVLLGGGGGAAGILKLLGIY